MLRKLDFDILKCFISVLSLGQHTVSFIFWLLSELGFGLYSILLNPDPNKPFFFTCLQYKSFENKVKKGEIACNEQYLLFPQSFLSFWTELSVIFFNSKLSSAISLCLDESKICRLVGWLV